MKLATLLMAVSPQPFSGISAFQAIQLTKLPVKVAYRVGKNLRLIEQELTNYNDMRQKLLTQYEATIEEGAKEYTFPEGKKEEFNAAHTALVEENVELPLLLSSVEEIADYAIEPWVLSALDGICFKV